MRLFKLVRSEDVSGVSGTGAVAEGVVFTDGTVVLRWLGVRTSTGIYKSLEMMLEVHGHEGATVVEWVD